MSVDSVFLREGKVNIRPEIRIIVGVRSEGVPVVGEGGGWGKVVG